MSDSKQQESQCILHEVAKFSIAWSANSGNGEESMKISARNNFSGTVKEITKGAVNAQVTLQLDKGESIISIITNSSVESLGLSVGGTAFAIVKASDVIVGKGLDGAKLSARNVIAGVVAGIVEGAVNCEIEIQIAGGFKIVSIITKESVAALSIKIGDAVFAIVKASNVLIGV